MKKTLICIFLIFTIKNSFGQSFHRKKGQENLLILSPGVSIQGNDNYYSELNLMLAKIESGGPCSQPVIYGPTIGIETNFNKDHFVYAPKIGYELSAMVLGFRGNVMTYIDKGNVDLRILPEIGISFLGFANLNYGYNIPVLNFKTNATTNHRLTLTINLDFDLWDEIKK